MHKKNSHSDFERCDGGKRRRLPEEDVQIPFHSKIPAGHSLFTVKIPREFSNRRFYFEDLRLVPNFYSQQALDMKLDTDAEMNEAFEYSLNFLADCGANLFPGKFEMPSTVADTPSMAKSINNFFENRGIGMLRLGVFFDWHDLRYDRVAHLYTWKYFVEVLMAEAYYGIPYDESKHFNWLPSSARTIVGANNYLFPTDHSAENLENLRFRILLSPNTDAVFSTEKHLLAMGFGEDQLLPKVKQQIRFTNPNVTGYSFVQGEDPVGINLGKVPPLKVNMTSNSETFAAEPITFQILRKDERHNADMLTAMKEALSDLAQKTNWVLDIAYLAKQKKFQFVFPQNDNIVIQLRLEEELSNRLGFSFTDVISRSNNTSTFEVDDEPDVNEAIKKSRAVVYDTAIVVVSQENKTSKLTSGIYGKCMALLYSKEGGNMEMPPSERKATMQLSNIFSVTEDSFPATFRLSRYFDKLEADILESELVHFEWRQTAYVYGMLRGYTAD